MMTYASRTSQFYMCFDRYQDYIDIRQHSVVMVK
jgi:hypothetical protein